MVANKDFDLSNRRYLVVDDQLLIRALVVRILQSSGATAIDEAANVEQALSLIASQGDTLDCVISDIIMPPRNGLELAQEIRTGQAGARRDLPIVLLTGASESQFARLAVSLDVNGFVVKPISPYRLAGLLVQVCERPARIKPIEAYRALTVTSASGLPPGEPATTATLFKVAPLQ